MRRRQTSLLQAKIVSSGRREVTLWQFANDGILKKNWLDVGKHSMRLAFGSKSKLEMREKLWRSISKLEISRSIRTLCLQLTGCLSESLMLNPGSFVSDIVPFIILGHGVLGKVHGYRLQIDTVEGGLVKVEAL
jgi:hypothetical protein